MLPSDPVGQSLLVLLAAAAVMFGGVRLLWAGLLGAGLMRGAVLAVPIVALAILFTIAGTPGTGIALLLACSVFMLTLGVGIGAANVIPGGGVGSPALRLLAPMCLVTCLIGFHGELTLIHAAVLCTTGALVFWTAAEHRSIAAVRFDIARLVAAAAVLAIGIALMLIAIRQFQSAAGMNVVTPIVVLMIGPAALIGLLGVMGRHDATGEIGSNTAVGFVTACLGFGQSLVIIIAELQGRFTHATTQPSGIILMPVASWRVDSVLLVVLSILFFPVGVGRFKLGRLEGLALVILYLIYARVAVHTGSLHG